MEDEDAQPAAVVTTSQLDQLRKVARDGGVGETLRELEDTLEETTDMVDELLAAGLRQQAGLRQRLRQTRGWRARTTR